MSREFETDKATGWSEELCFSLTPLWTEGGV